MRKRTSSLEPEQVSGDAGSRAARRAPQPLVDGRGDEPDVVATHDVVPRADLVREAGEQRRHEKQRHRQRSGHARPHACLHSSRPQRSSFAASASGEERDQADQRPGVPPASGRPDCPVSPSANAARSTNAPFPTLLTKKPRFSTVGRSATMRRWIPSRL